MSGLTPRGAGSAFAVSHGRGTFGVLALVGVVALLSGCAPRVDARYAHAMSEADALYVGGRYRESADAWLAASHTAGSAYDRDEAVYRAAASYERGGEPARADALLAALASGSGERAARASFDRAALAAETDPARGERLRLAALLAHPESGVASAALRAYLEGVATRDGERAALARCEALRRELSATALDEATSYACAARHEALHEAAAALADYLATAERHPYPDGALWDDALAGAARAEEALGEPRAAIALLERMLAEREQSFGIGSYERSRYAPARFHIAELYRDALHDPARARREFRRVAVDHPTSLLGARALFEEARLAARAGDDKSACGATAFLHERFPESRFDGCGALVCPRTTAAKRPCSAADSVLLTHAATPTQSASSSFSFSSSSSSSSSSP